MQKLEEEIVSRQKIRQAEQVIGKSQLRHLLLDENPKPEEIESLSQKFGETFSHRDTGSVSWEVLLR